MAIDNHIGESLLDIKRPCKPNKQKTKGRHEQKNKFIMKIQDFNNKELQLLLNIKDHF